jgi:hypothetical protein
MDGVAVRLVPMACARPGGSRVHTLRDSTRSGGRGGARGWQGLRPLRVGGSAHVGAGPGITTQSVPPALLPAAGASER